MTATLLFDLDGTIVETDHVHFKAFQNTFAPHGVSVDWETYRKTIIGKANPAIAAAFLPHVPVDRHHAIMENKEAAYRALLGEIEPAPGLLDLLAWAERHAIPCAVVTNAPRANAELVLKSLGLDTRFDVLVIGPELADAKPHPLPYLTALALLGGAAASSVAFEDSPSGATSAVAAGLGVVGLLTSVDASDLTAVGVEIMAKDFTDAAVLAYVSERTGTAR
ncbi:HAD-IA family hydrolase [Lichenihabitans sp. PAMC28606]|uniref:HAD family hydrolase n=1 Tax=Lichenihabitans sp. PAMC28606 TaxID=2880932 RepID=UPI001D0B0EC8|nr:HAD-IA family hydrolase [Lichenihabitans sp. PAMC28606]UDL95727.1 HAD-IA family hydrolase [Lichenihabitans sp. PAMC28606]